MPDWIELYTAGESAVAMLARLYRDQAQAAQAAAAASASLAAASVPATADRTVGAQPGDTGLWQMMRATPAWGFNSLGLLEEVPVDTLRWDFDQGTRAPLGVAFAGSRLNNVIGARAEGAVPGTPGTDPTGWGTRPAAAPTTQIVGLATRQGIPGVLVRFAGVPTTSGFQEWRLQTAITVSIGQILSASAFVALEAGTLTNVANFTFRTLSAGDTGQVWTPGALQRLTRTFIAASTQATALLRWNYPSVVTAVDFTLFVGVPQLEFAPFVSAPILPPVGSPGAFTRAQGSVSIPVRDLGTRYNYRQGLVVLDWNSLPGPFSSADDLDWLGLVSLGDQTANDVMGMVINPAHNSVEFRRTVSGVVQPAASRALTAPAAGETIRCAFAWDADAGLMQVAARGAAGAQLTGQAGIPAISHLMAGRFSTTRPLFGRINGIDVRPGALFGASLAALT